MGKGSRSTVGPCRPDHPKRLAISAGLFALTVGLTWLNAGASAQQPGPATSKAPSPVAAPAPAAKSDANQPPVTWKRIPEADRKVLAPLEKEWSSLPGQQQRRLLGAAKHFPKLTPVEQERFQERLKSWSHLSPDQRKAARDKYQSLTNLPPSKQEELKARWQTEKQADKSAAPTSTPPVK